MLAHVRKAAVLAVVFTFALTLWAQTPAPSPSSASNFDPVLTVPPGEHLVLELQGPLHTGQNVTGDQAHFTTVREVVVGYQVAVPPGSSVRATLTEVKKPGRAGRGGQMAFHFDEIILPDGTTLPFEASLIRAGFADLSQGKSGTQIKGEGATSKGDLVAVAVGAGQGALIGATVGGQKGAAYGGAIGAGIGLMEILLRRGPHLDLPRGMLFEVELNRGLPVPLASAARFTQQGPSLASLPPASAPAADTGGFRFPDDPGAVPADDVPIPDFPEDNAGADNTATVATNRVPPPPGTPAEPPASTEPVEAPPSAGPPLPPDFGDPNAYRLKVDVRLITVEAFVRDQHGRVMDALTRQDFRLVEDGVEQSIRHFSRDELPLAVALVVDRSGSVAPYMPELRRAAYQTLSQLKSGDQVVLFSFAADVERLTELTTDRRYIAEQISRIRAGGGTNISDALAMAANYLGLAAPDRRRIIVLISDNEETTRGFTSQSGVIRIALESEVVIYSIKTPGQATALTMHLPATLRGMSSVRKITRETGGEIIDVNRVGSLEAALATVVARLKTRYTLGYQSTNKTADGAFRKIEVRLADRFGQPERDYDVYARSGYYAPDERRAAQPAEK